jgi:hypothetical protein
MNMPNCLFKPASLLFACALLVTPALRAEKIDGDQLSNIVKVLASDEFEGRAPGGPGEEKTVSWLIEQFKSLGLSPGGKNNSWTQAVSLLHTQIQQAEIIAIDTSRAAQKISIKNAPLVFVGFGASAPERQWDDYGDIDLTGKVAIFLVNDPDFAAQPNEPVAGRFGNRRMTYYGRWTYKFEEAERRGALAALVIHEDKAA